MPASGIIFQNKPSRYTKVQEYTATAIKYDAGGVRYEADLGGGNATSGQTLSLKSTSDPSLKWEQKDILGVGANSGCPLPIAFILLIAGGAFVAAAWRRN